MPVQSVPMSYTAMNIHVELSRHLGAHCPAESPAAGCGSLSNRHRATCLAQIETQPLSAPIKWKCKLSKKKKKKKRPFEERRE